MFVLFGYDARIGWNLVCERKRFEHIDGMHQLWATRYAHVAIVGPGCTWQALFTPRCSYHDPCLGGQD